MTVSPALALYRALSGLVGPVVRAQLTRRAAAGKEDTARLPERLGRPGLPRPAGALVWLHGASIGEAVSALPLIAALGAARPGLSVLLTTGTRTAAEQVAPRLPPCARHQYVPVDTRRAVAGFLGHWRPDLAVWIESELWPRLVSDTARRGVPMALVNARMSERSARRWAWAPGMARALLAPFRLVVAQDGASAGRLRRLGAAPVREGASLKSTVLPAEPAPEALAAAFSAVAGRPVWLAASTHEGEEEAALAAHASLPAGTLLVLAPRHPERGDAVAALAADARLPVARRSRGEMPGAETRIWLADTLGEMGLWYRIAPVSFVGGSLAAMGGHTPFEPAALGSAIVHGPDTRNFAPAYAALAGAGGALAVHDAAALGEAVGRLLADAAARKAQVAAARAVRAALTPDLPALAAELLALMDEGR